MVNKVLDFFNQIRGLLIFLIFVLLLMEHLHHGHFHNRGHHQRVEAPVHPGDTSGTKTDIP